MYDNDVIIMYVCVWRISLCMYACVYCMYLIVHHVDVHVFVYVMYVVCVSNYYKKFAHI